MLAGKSVGAIGVTILLVVNAPAADGQQSTNQASGQSSGSALLLAPAAPAVRGLYLDAVPSTSGDPAVRGKPLSLRVDVTPKRDIHVYAPGNPSYTPVELVIDPMPGASVGAVIYPKAEEFFFAPLKERVRVYSSAFRLTRDVTLGMAPRAPLLMNPAASLIIKGRLEYQACDDKVCYRPQTLPITWTIALKQ